MAYLQRQKRVKKCTRHGATVPEERSKPNVGSLDGAAVEFNIQFFCRIPPPHSFKESAFRRGARASAPLQHRKKCGKTRDEDEKGYHGEKRLKKKICPKVAKQTRRNVAAVYGLSDREEEVSR